LIGPLVGLVSRIPARIQFKLLAAFLAIAISWPVSLPWLPPIGRH